MELQGIKISFLMAFLTVADSVAVFGFSVVGAWYASGLYVLLPRLFLVHSLMAFAVLVDAVLWLLMKLFVRR